MVEIKYRSESEMEDSRIKWFGNIPNDWDLTKVKRILNVGRGRVIAKTELNDNFHYPVYSSQTKNDGILGYISTYDFDITQLTWTTDGANAGTVFIREGKHNCTNVCGTLQLKTKENNIMFLKYLLEYTAIFHKRADTNGYKIMNNEMLEISITLPKLNEQIKISNFLDIKTTELDQVISKKEKLIEKLEEAKKSLISEVVTGKVKIVDGKLIPRDDNEMKDSGVGWLGVIPKDWDVKKIKHISYLKSGNTITSSLIESSGIYPVFGGNGFRGFTNKYTHNGEYLLIGRQGALCGNINYAKGKFWASEHAVVVYSTQDINNIWFGELLRSMDLNQYSMSAAQPGISVGMISELKIPYIKKSIQDELSIFLKDKSIHFDEIIRLTKTQIQKLTQAKQSLISEAVTGKIDLRDWEIKKEGEVE